MAKPIPLRSRCKRAVPELLHDYAKANGWHYTRTRKGHFRFFKEGRAVIFTSGTPSDWRAVRNALAMLARADRVEVVLA
ncbi:hypothetical protein [Pseudomonas aeruginosa]|uniref:hypothetical protein n=1 Tax=Pseudomonas aeruginosa TaxID=287 RepID=UPI000B96CE19|nr:hypothetical protein [Pseudomonas aeruginosa]OYP21897.1 hypothetical protein CHH44_30790 [Pseudomonas aeruginosa]OYP24407.1 hypothetical protein CHH44_26550 [Pseudomonas aeruginosa]